MTDTGTFVEGSFDKLGTSIRDLAYQKLEEECAAKFQSELSGLDHITVDHDGGLVTVSTPDGDIGITFDPISTVSSSNLDVTPIRDSGIFDYIPDFIKRYDNGDTAACAEADRVLSKFATQNSSEEGLSGEIKQWTFLLASATADWRGKAASSFYGFFVTPMDQARFHQHEIGKELRAAVQAQQGIIDKGEATARIIAQDTYVTLANYPKSADPWSVLSPIIGAALAAISLAVSTTPPGLSLTMSLLTLANTAANSGEAVSSAVHTDQSSTLEIIDAMHVAFNNLDEQIRDESDAVRNALNHTTKEVEKVLNSNPDMKRNLLPVRPSIADELPTVDQFEPPNV